MIDKKRLKFLVFALIATCFAGCDLFKGKVVAAEQGAVVKVKSRKEYDKVLTENSNLVVDFFADWCGPCKRMQPLSEKVAMLYPEIKIVEVDVDNKEFESLKEKFKVRGIPLFVFMVKGKEKTRVEGAMALSKYKNTISSSFGLPIR